MTDVRITWSQALATGDLAIDPATLDLAAEDGLATAVILSLFTDRRDPEAEEAGEPPRGWWADGLAPDGDEIGSLLWTLDRAKNTDDVPVRAEEFSREALAWMVADGVASAVDVAAERSGRYGLSLDVTVMLPTGDLREYQFRAVSEVA